MFEGGWALVKVEEVVVEMQGGKQYPTGTTL
jgi:hypothetical protein